VLIGVGLDLAATAFWRDALEDPATDVLAGTFTPAELSYARSTSGEVAEHLAARFAAKEAFVKALGASHRHRRPRVARLDQRDIEVRNDEYGRPYLVLSGEAQATAEQLGVRHIWLSLTHEESTAAAVVVLEG